MKTEIAVIGAGPAGSVAAGMLAQRGHDVVLIDKAEFPRDKNCGDAICPMGLDIAAELGLTEELRAAEPHDVRSIRFTFDNKLVVKVDFNFDLHGVILPRRKFDSILYKYATSSGALPIKALVRNPLFENDRIIGVETNCDGKMEKIYARVVVVADGANSSIARLLNRNLVTSNGYAIRAYIENLPVEQHNMEFYFEAGSFGYGWVFPVDLTTANVGYGQMNSAYANEKTIKNSYDEFIRFCLAKASNPEKVVVHHAGGSLLNFGFQKSFRRVFDGAIILGDAARLINPVCGAGITNAMCSGKLAAISVDNALKRNDVSLSSLQEYERRLRKQMYWEQKFAHWILELNRLPLPIQHFILKSGSIVNFLTSMYRYIYTDIPDITLEKKVETDGVVGIQVRA